MDAYSRDLRVRILADCDAGMRTGPVAAKYSVSAAFVRRLKQRRRETGEAVPAPRSHRPHNPRPRALAGREDELRALVEEKPDRTARELVELLGHPCAESTLSALRRRLGYRFKKRP